MQEGVYVDNKGVAQFDWERDDILRDSIFLKFGKNYHISRKRGDTIFHICFRLNPRISGQNKRSLLKIIGNYAPDDDNYKLFLSKASMGLSASSVVDLKNVDVIITPQSGKTLSYDLAKNLESRTSNAILYPRYISKIDISLIKIDYEKVKQKKINPKVVEWLESQLKGMVDNGEFKIKNIRPQYRTLLTNFLKLSEENRRLLNLVNDGVVMIIDDYFTTGSTLKESENLLKSYGAREIVLVAMLG